MTIDDRAQDLLDQLREGRGQQKQINNELYRRVAQNEENVKKNNDNLLLLDGKINALSLKIVASASIFAGIVTALVETVRALIAS